MNESVNGKAKQPSLFSAKAKLAVIVKRRRARMPPADPAAWVGMKLRSARNPPHMPPETCTGITDGVHEGVPVAVFATWSRRHQGWSYKAVSVDVVRLMIGDGFWRLAKR